ncbi:hypothetical protein OOK12_42580 [Streptomyces sp. NBC_00452]|nr:hypothetical protein [Streptomyces sp. NBC_00452]MCX5063574.1 hypothetical protein [Streptomyces sp. NBC_00452]
MHAPQSGEQPEYQQRPPAPQGRPEEVLPWLVIGLFLDRSGTSAQ